MLIIVTGEDMQYDWNHNRINGLDLASEGFVVASIQYRSNIFGWLNINNGSKSNGNYGLLDQSLAIHWLIENIEQFGGDRKQLSLLGHGTTGARCAFWHYLTWHEEVSSISRHFPLKCLFLMSGGKYEEIFDSAEIVSITSERLIEKLSCQFEENQQDKLNCLRNKSVQDLLNAYVSIYENDLINNKYYKPYLGPLIEKNLTEMFEGIGKTLTKTTLIIGITSNEGAFIQEYWLHLARNGYNQLFSFIENTILKDIRIQSKNNVDAQHQKIWDFIKWHYFPVEETASLRAHLLSEASSVSSPVSSSWPLTQRLSDNVMGLLDSFQRYLSEWHFEVPFYRFLTKLISIENVGNIFAYNYDMVDAIDMRGQINHFQGAGHSAELPLLLGPSLFQQIARRRFNSHEEGVFHRLRGQIMHFIRNAEPKLSAVKVDWLPYTKQTPFVYSLGEIWNSVAKKRPFSASAGFITETFLDTLGYPSESSRSLPESSKSLPGSLRELSSSSLHKDFTGFSGDDLLLYSTTNESDKRRHLSKDINFEKSIPRAEILYVKHLKRASKFNQLLESYYRKDQFENITIKQNLSEIELLQQNRIFRDVAADAVHYRQAFFLLLILVIILLVSLTLCVYVLKNTTKYNTKAMMQRTRISLSTASSASLSSSSTKLNL